MMKSKFLFLFVFFTIGYVLATSGYASVAEFNPTEPINLPKLDPTYQVNFSELNVMEKTEEVINYMIYLFWILMVGFLIWSAYLFLSGTQDNIAAAKQRVLYAIVAAFVAILGVGIKPLVTSFFDESSYTDVGGGGGLTSGCPFGLVNANGTCSVTPGGGGKTTCNDDYMTGNPRFDLKINKTYTEVKKDPPPLFGPKTEFKWRSAETTDSQFVNLELVDDTCRENIAETIVSNRGGKTEKYDGYRSSVYSWDLCAGIGASCPVKNQTYTVSAKFKYILIPSLSILNTSEKTFNSSELKESIKYIGE